jgi:hypothetical protein
MVESIKRELDQLLRWHNEPESFLRLLDYAEADIPRDATRMREGAARKLARIYAQTLGVDFRRRRRLVLMIRIGALADGHTDTDEIVPPFFLDEGYVAEISDDDLAPVVRVWNSRGPGAKKGSAVSKWEALSRVLRTRLGDHTKPKSLEADWRQHQKDPVHIMR